MKIEYVTAQVRSHQNGENLEFRGTSQERSFSTENLVLTRVFFNETSC